VRITMGRKQIVVFLATAFRTTRHASRMQYDRASRGRKHLPRPVVLSGGKHAAMIVSFSNLVKKSVVMYARSTFPQVCSKIQTPQVTIHNERLVLSTVRSPFTSMRLGSLNMLIE
jgi:hypothetical protein